jgi:hypothetical protein
MLSAILGRTSHSPGSALCAACEPLSLLATQPHQGHRVKALGTGHQDAGRGVA